MGTNSLLPLWNLLFWLIVVVRKWLSAEPSQKQSGRNLAAEIIIKIFLLFAQSSLAHNGPSLGLTRLILCWHISVAFKQLRTWGKDLGSICTFHRHVLNYFELCCDLEDFNLQGQRSILKVATVSYSFCPLAVSMPLIYLGWLSGKQTCSGWTST